MSNSILSAPVLSALTRRPSKASAAAIGINFVLNGAPPALRLRGIDALARMMCNWSVAILEETITDHSRPCLLRTYALERLGGALNDAIHRGYPRLSETDKLRLLNEARQALATIRDVTADDEIPAVTEMCNHLDEATRLGLFGELPDF